ncbi:L-lactate dehydrogenase [Limibacter armeniacum]|uniref:L-lactate dehydrogenase n=1 Tax=Limibacter armeniacum TaxID=466084 RepID=UPI0038CC0B5E
MKNPGNNKVVLIGTGFVGMSYAYAMLNQGGAGAREFVLIDVDKEKAIGEAMDLNHGLAFAPRALRIWAGDYKDCADADLVVISAGISQQKGETRLELLTRNAAIFHDIVEEVMSSGFNGIFLVATNPVDIMTYLTWKYSGLPQHRVIGSGTTLDTARLRYMLGDRLNVNPKNVHAYIMGEHGDSEFAPWSVAMVGVKPILKYVFDKQLDFAELEKTYEGVRDAAYHIIEKKKATYYGIGMALTSITEAILNNSSSILSISCYLDGQYGITDVYMGVPSILHRNGVKEIMELSLTAEDLGKLHASAHILQNTIKSVIDKEELQQKPKKAPETKKTTSSQTATKKAPPKKKSK